MSLVPRLMRDLNGEGIEVTALGGDEYAVTPRPGTHRNGMRFIIPERELQELIRNLSKDGHDVFPDVTPLEGAYRLLLVHIEETLATRPSSSLVRVTSAGLRVESDAGAGVLPPIPADTPKLKWTTERPTG